ncbi:MAG: DUF1194 domain-containing protein [Hyphomicrobium sp.]|nr:DUF1194 domain-containing protein [Hyphomicrobium sp.]
MALAALLLVPAVHAQEAQVDTALIVSIDVSNSVDGDRYKLQMEGIAKALEDPGVIEAIIGGPNGGILFSMVTWADRPALALPWVKIASKEDALALAARVRKLPLQGGEFTCMTKMLRSANDKIVPQIPAKALRVVIDVSGDGPDNCNADEPIETVRDELVANGVTINGLPILDGANAGATTGGVVAPGAEPNTAAKPTDGSKSLEEWFKTHVQGGTGSFVLPANGYSDFARAIRQKFIIEISGLVPPQRFAGRSLGNLPVNNRLVAIDGAVKAQSAAAPAKLE